MSSNNSEDIQPHHCEASKAAKNHSLEKGHQEKRRQKHDKPAGLTHEILTCKRVIEKTY